MLSWIRKYRESTRETRLFVLTSILYTAAIILPAIYCYARLDFVRSYDTSAKAAETRESK
jgi:hypothetical protein